MFERYTEHARRTLFFARYESSQFGSLSIEPEHLLLGVAREPRGIIGIILAGPGRSAESIRDEIVRRMTTVREKVATSVEIPFGDQTKRALQYAAEEADRLAHSHIGVEHLLLGLMREEGTLAASVLAEQGLHLDEVRERLVALIQEHPQPDEPREAVERIKALVRQLAGSLPGDNKQALVEQIDAQLEALYRSRPVARPQVRISHESA